MKSNLEQREILSKKFHFNKLLLFSHKLWLTIQSVIKLKKHLVIIMVCQGSTASWVRNYPFKANKMQKESNPAIFLKSLL